MFVFLVFAFLFQRSFAVASSEDCGLKEVDRLLINKPDGVHQDLWSDQQKMALTYCVSSNLASNRERVIEALLDAQESWMAVANVHFQFVSGDCGKGDALFRVQAVSRHSKFKAMAFFPSSSESERVIQINRKFASADAVELNRILLHELGHVLGFRHEHIHSEANGVCSEAGEFDAVTDYDPDSIMHYARCGAKGVVNYQLSDLDKVGAQSLYPF